MDLSAIPAWPGVMEGGRYFPKNPQAARRYMKEAFREGERVQMAIWSEGKVRTLPQNAYYWGVCITVLGIHLGYNVNDPNDRKKLHNGLRNLFLMDLTVPIPAPRSTTELTTIEFSQYLEDIWRYSVEEHDCFIPDPSGFYVKKPPPFKQMNWRQTGGNISENIRP